MKIGIITDSLDETCHSGVQNYTFNLVKSLLEIDNKNDYTLIHRSNNSGMFKGVFKELLIRPFWFPPRMTIRRNIILPFVLRRRNFDIIHHPVQAGPFLFRQKAITVQTIHDMSSIAMPKTQSRLTVIYDRIILPRMLKNIDYVLTISKYSKNEIARHLNFPKEKIKVIYIGVSDFFRVLKNKKEIRSRLDIDYDFLLCVGNIEPRKNLGTIIESFHELRTRGFKHKLVIIGSEKKVGNLYGLITALGLRNEVIFTGYVDNSTLRDYYNLADIFLFPSLYEGFGIPPLEAMACGCPVIASNTTSLPEVVGDAAIMICPTKTSEIVCKIQALLRSRKQRAILINRGLKRVKRFTWKRCAKETLDFYKEIYEK
jgi:glycosyltransferase involved in cell wall biosynthesis